MFTYPSPASLAGPVSQDVVLTTQQKALIKTEITTDPLAFGYAGMSASAKLQTFISPYALALPNSAPAVLRTGLMSTSDFYALMDSAPAVAGGSSALDVFIAATNTKSQWLKAWIGANQQLNFTAGKFVNALTQWLNNQVPANIPQASVDLILRAAQHPSRLDEVLGLSGCVITSTEFAAAIA